MNFKEKMCWNIQRKSLCNRGIGGVCVISARAFQRYAEF